MPKETTENFELSTKKGIAHLDNFLYHRSIPKKGRCVMKKIGVMMGSDSDLPVVKKAIDTLKEFGVPYEVHI